jgi:elongation factor 1-gamma
LAVAKENNLDIEIVETRPPVQDLEYFKLNPLGRVPTFVGANGYILTETIAIAVYCRSSMSLSRLRDLSKMSHIINTVIPV